MKTCKTYLLCALFSLLAVSQASAQSVVGAWSGGDTTKEGSGVLVFFANGSFYYIENVAKAEAPSGFPGYERGTYTWNAATGAFTLNVLQDLNGNTGIGVANGLAGMTAAISGDTLAINAPGAGSLVGTRVTGTSPIVGAWSLGNAAIADSSVVIVFLSNGVYFLAQDGDSSPVTGDPSGHDGIEHGTYAWNPTTGVLTSSRTPAPYVDTNGEWGLSNPSSSQPFTFNVSADGLTLTGHEGSDSFSLARVGAAAAPTDFTPVAGLWANANELGTGYTLEFKHGVLVVAIYAYTSAGAAQWYLASGPVTANVFTATLDKYTGGQCISCPFTRSPGPPTGNDGTMTITFTSSTSAIVNLPGGRVTTISPFQF